MSASPAETAECPNCGGDVPQDARFCPTCGARLQAGSTAVIPPPPDETGRVPISVTSVEPHLFGVTPPLAVLVVAVAALALGLLLVGLGRLVPGLLLLACGVVLAAVFVSVSRGDRAGAAGDRARATGDRLRLAATTLGARSAATREATRLRHELERLDEERADRARALGEAVHAGSDAEGAALRDELSELDERIAGLRHELELVPARAHEQVARAKLEVQPTEMVDRGSEPDRAQD